MSETRELIRTTGPRDCYDACGMVVVKRQGEIVRVKGDPEHPVSRGELCGKCAVAYNGAWIDRNARLTQPLKRVGVKGQGQFVPITWDEAMAAIAEKLQEVLITTGGQSILHTHYTGTCSLIVGFFPCASLTGLVPPKLIQTRFVKRTRLNRDTKSLPKVR